MKWEKVLILVIINIILFVSIEIIFLYPLKHKIRFGFSEYTERKSISDLDNIFKKAINNIDLNDNTDISFDDTFGIYITRNDRRYRGIGKIIINGKYQSIDNLINFLNSLEIEYDIEEIMNNKNKSIHVADGVAIILQGQDGIRISYSTYIQYNHLKGHNYDNEFEKYFIAIEEKIIREYSKKINNIYIKEFFFLLILNILIVLIYIKKFQKYNNISFFVDE